MNDLRRDLAGLRVVSSDFDEAVVQKAGFIKPDGSLEVRFLFRGRMRATYLPSASATVDQVVAAVSAAVESIVAYDKIVWP